LIENIQALHGKPPHPEDDLTKASPTNTNACFSTSQQLLPGKHLCQQFIILTAGF